VGWQDRDWAKWTDEERARFVGSSTHHSTWDERPRAVGRASAIRPGAFLAVIVSLVATLGLSGMLKIPLLERVHAPASPTQTFPNVYGTGVVVADQDGRSETCTEILDDATCTEYTFIQPGQHALRAAPLPSGETCPLMEVDQARGAWVCVKSAAPPAPPSMNS
jgi:hypothetical protein